MSGKKIKTAAYTLAVVVLIAAVTVGCTFAGAKAPDKADGSDSSRDFIPTTGKKQYSLNPTPEITEPPVLPKDLAVDAKIDLPAPVVNYAAEYTQRELDFYTFELGYEITEAKITGLRQISTGTAGNTHSINMYLLEYRFRPADPGKVMLAGGMRIEDGYITEHGSAGQPYLLLDEADGRWQRICVTNTDVITQEYGTPEMLKKYGSAYTAAAMELYTKFRNGLAEHN